MPAERRRDVETKVSWCKERSPALLSAIAVVASDGLPNPMSLCVREEEIVALVFPDVPDPALLRALAGLTSPQAGLVSWRASTRIVLTGAGATLQAALLLRPDLVILHSVDGLSRSAEHDVWDLLEAERNNGVTFVVAMSRIERARRADRVSLAAWGWSASCVEIDRVATRMEKLTCKLLDPAPAEHATLASVSTELRWLSRGVLVFLEHLRGMVSSKQEAWVVQELCAKIADVKIDDHVLELVIAGTVK